MKKRTMLAVLIAALVMPGCAFSKFNTRTIQREARTNLASIATAEIVYFAEFNEWGDTFETIQWWPDGVTRYTYYLNSCEEVAPSTSAGNNQCPQELQKFFDECHKNKSIMFPECGENNISPENRDICKFFCAAAVANIDGDPKLDIWMVDPRKNPVAVQDDLVR